MLIGSHCRAGLTLQQALLLNCNAHLSNVQIGIDHLSEAVVQAAPVMVCKMLVLKVRAAACHLVMIEEDHSAVVLDGAST